MTEFVAVPKLWLVELPNAKSAPTTTMAMPTISRAYSAAS